MGIERTVVIPMRKWTSTNRECRFLPQSRDMRKIYPRIKGDRS
jgi:hypothetical protein